MAKIKQPRLTIFNAYEGDQGPIPKWNVKWFSPSGEQSGGFFKINNVLTVLICDSATYS